jgi:hypothetical protein
MFTNGNQPERKMKVKLNLVLIVGLLAISFLACEGPEGPEGQIGAIGPSGSAGPAGEQGEVGPAGNSDLSVIEFNYTLSEGEIDGEYVFYELTTTLIDADVLNNGTVIVQSGSSGEYSAMPLTECYDDDDNGEVDECYELTYWYELNKLTIVFSNTSPSFIWNSAYRVYIKASIFGS